VVVFPDVLFRGLSFVFVLPVLTHSSSCLFPVPDAVVQ